jgi:hypothetical protein
MKDLWKSGVLILLIIGVVYILYLRECKRPLPCPPEGQVLLSQQTWDSIRALADKPPVVKIDTFWKERPVVKPDPQPPMPQPKPDTNDITINRYADSLINKEINVHYNFKVKGTLLSREWWYKPITIEIRTDSTVYVPKIVEVEKPVLQPQNGLYLYGTAGGNKNSFLFGGGLDVITKKGTELGYMYQRFGSEGFHSVKLGGKIKFRKN